MATPQAGQHHDTFALNTLFAELCDLLAAASRPEVLFINTDKAFDINALHQTCARRNIEVNIPRNHRTADWQADDDTLLIPKLYQRRQVIEQMNA